MAGVSYIGKPISLVSHSDIRYRGTLHGIDPAASTISLADVISMGTEDRRPSESYIPPSDVPYEFIIFRASEVKDIAVDQTTPPPPRRNVHDDPAVMTVSSAGQMQRQVAQQSTYTEPQVIPTSSQQGARPSQPNPTQDNASPTPSKPLANASRNANGADTGMENVQRAMGELRGGNAQQASRRGRVPQSTIKAGEINIPSTEFDFARSNALFEKVPVDSGCDSENTNPSEDGEILPNRPKVKTPEAEKAYNPKTSFFDSLGIGNRGLSTESSVQGSRGGHTGRGRRGSSRREEERQRNVATFGEPGGGPGLMGPGAYVPGWGGARSRGQGRGGRRGGPPRGMST